MADEWKCSGCGVVSADRVRRCDCATACLFIYEPGRMDGGTMRHEIKLPSPSPDAHWAVSVAIDGTQIVCIESNCLSGVEGVDRYAETIRTCAQHLLAFIGDAHSSSAKDSKP